MSWEVILKMPTTDKRCEWCGQTLPDSHKMEPRIRRTRTHELGDLILQAINEGKVNYVMDISNWLKENHPNVKFIRSRLSQAITSLVNRGILRRRKKTEFGPGKVYLELVE